MYLIYFGADGLYQNPINFFSANGPCPLYPPTYVVFNIFVYYLHYWQKSDSRKKYSHLAYVNKIWGTKHLRARCESLLHVHIVLALREV